MRSPALVIPLLGLSIGVAVVSVDGADRPPRSAQPEAPRIDTVDPFPPYCVLRSSASTYDRRLELHGDGLQSTDHRLQFRNEATQDESIHFNLEIDWVDDRLVAVDMARISSMLWSGDRIALRARVTSGTYVPLSAWSPVFLLAEDVLACGQARPTATAVPTATPVPLPPRGQAGDLWADVVLGKPDFGEIAPYEVVPYKVFNPGGVTVDARGGVGFAYVWDSGNSRILGIDLASCYAGSQACAAPIVIGQPSGFDHAACNGDSGFQTYPRRAPASPDTLCGVRESTLTPLEDKSFVSMSVDADGNLYVPDFHNNRVLRYDRPRETDAVADRVWGQADFAGNTCNKGDLAPSASTLCLVSGSGLWGAGVEIDTDGNMWVADGANHRVLRFPRDTATGSPSSAPDLVLGQSDFNSNATGSAMERLSMPGAVRSAPDGRLFVADSGNNRLLVFDPPFTSGMAASETFGSRFNSPSSIEVDLGRKGLWVLNRGGEDILAGGRTTLELWSWSGTRVGYLDLGSDGGGSIGVDSEGGVLAAAYGYVQDVLRVDPAAGATGTFAAIDWLFSPPGGYNYMGNKGLRAGHGIAVHSDQVVVADGGRLLFWNDVDHLANGQVADGIIGDRTFVSYVRPCCGQLKVDEGGRLWSQGGQGAQIRVFTMPLADGAAPQDTLDLTGRALPVLGGGTTTFGRAAVGFVPVGRGNRLWVTDVDHHRVLRLRDPLTRPVVDVILGQADASGGTCNRGASGTPAADMLCTPGLLSLDRLGNLFVSDHFLEAAGNGRLLVFDSGLFPDNPSRAVFGPPATKVFPRTAVPWVPATWEPAFDAQNRMVVGYNPYLTGAFGHFPGVYYDPLGPSTRPDAIVRDYHSMAYAAAFDDAGNLYIGDSNRSRVLIYYRPFEGLGTVTPSPTSAVAAAAVLLPFATR